jgi:hypothetical protein
MWAFDVSSVLLSFGQTVEKPYGVL